MTTSIRSLAGIASVVIGFLAGSQSANAQARPSITSQPENTNAIVGANAGFAVTASGQSPLAYQWFFNNGILSDSNHIGGSGTAALTISNAATNNAGNYFVTVSNRHGIATSAVVSLTVLVPVTLAAEPTSNNVFEGDGASFEVAADGTTPLSYQWFFNGNPLSDTGRISGSTSSKLSITETLATDAGNYSVTVSNAFSGAVSSNAVLTVSNRLPAVSAFIPQTAARGALVQISGVGFSPAIVSNIVYFGAVRAEIVSASRTNLTVKVPVGATYAPLTVTVNGLMAASRTAFQPTFGGNGQPIGGATFLPRRDMPHSYAGYRSLIADLDADGKPDLATSASNTVYVFRNIGTNGILSAESFAPRVELISTNAPAAGLRDIASADVDGDGKLDLLLTDGFNRVGIYRNISTAGGLSTSSFAPVAYFACGNSPNHLAVGDIDLDGHMDVVTCDTADGTVSVLRGLSVPGNVAFAPRISFPTGNGAVAVTIQDLDGDGRPDLAVANQSANFLSVLRNLSTPGEIVSNSFAPKVDFATSTDHFTIVAGDIDGDGRADLLTGGKNNVLSVYRNLSSPGSFATNSFAPPVHFSNPGWVHDIALSDINGDGKPDICIVGELSSYMGIYQNQSTPGSFTGASLAPRADYSTGWNAWGISVGDMDGDGRPDILFCNDYETFMSMYQNATPFGGPPEIHSQITNLVVGVGSDAVIACDVTGQTPLGFRWMFNGTDLNDVERISGAQTPALTISTAQTKDSGNYQLVASNALGVATSAVVTVNVTILPPSLTQQPQDKNLIAGANATFSVAATGTAPLTYQWFFNDSPVTNDARISGSTNSILAISNVNTNDAGNYFVVVTNDAGAVTSSVAAMNVGVLPFITAQPLGGTNLLGSSVGFSVAADGTAPLSFQWRFNGNNLSDNVRITGTTTSSLAITNLISADAGTYSVIVSNAFGSVTSAGAVLTIVQPPSFSVQPAGRSVVPGLPTTFSATATGTSPITYQWQLNGTNVPGATSTSFTIAAVTITNFGIYNVVASNAYGWANSAGAPLTPGVIAAWGRNFSGECLVPGGLTNVFAVAGGSESSIAVRADGSVVAWGSGSGTNVPRTFTNVVAISSSGGTVALRGDGSIVGWNFGGAVPFPVPALTNITEVAAGFSHGLALRSDGKVFAWGAGLATNVPADLGRVSAIAAGVNHSLALRENGTVAAWGSSPGTNVPSGLNKVVAVAGGYLHSLALKADGKLVAWGTGAGTNIPAGLTNVAAIAVGGYPQGQAVNLAIRSNGTVVAWGDNGFGETNTPSALTNFVSVVVAGAPYHSLAIIGDGRPLITKQPVGGSSFVGRDFAFRIGSAVGEQPLSFQWQFEGTNILGATNSTLLLTNLTIAQSGKYTVVVSNQLGTTTSVPAFLTVLNNPGLAFLSQLPTVQTNYQGSKVLINVSVSGNGPLRYQWKFNGTNVSGGTNADLIFDPILMKDAGAYSVLVSNSSGGILSSVSTQRVLIARSWGNTPTDPPITLTNAVAVAVGSQNYLALRSDGKVEVWAPFLTGETIPASKNSEITAIAAGNLHNLVLHSDGSIFAWGSNAGLTNVPVSASNVVAISCGQNHDLALRSDGTIVGWGASTSGQITIPSSATNVVAISAGGNHSLALRDNGTIAAWGLNSSGQINVPSSATNIIAIAAGGGHSLALRADGTVLAWGDNSRGQTNVPPGLSNVVAIAASGGHNTALRADGSVVYWGSFLYYTTSGAVVLPTVEGAVQIADWGDRSVALLGDRAPKITMQPINRTLVVGSNAMLVAKAVGAQPMSYQWSLNGENLSGATNEILSFTNLQFSQAGVYQLIVSNSYGIAASKPAKLVVSLPLDESLDTTNRMWISGGVAPWFGQANTTHDGVDAARSGNIEDNGQSVFQTSVKTGGAQVSFWWKVSSETNFDTLEFRVNGAVLATISGETDWEQRTFSIPVGTDILEWRYSKNGNSVSGEDAAWVDQFVLLPNPPVISLQPSGRTVNMGATANFSIRAGGEGPLTYQWWKNATNAVGINSSLLTLTNVSRADRGIYSVVVSNTGGSTTSSNAVLNVLVPQKLGAPVLLSDGTLQFSSGDADGGLLSENDLANFTLQASSNLIDWVSLTNSLTLTNGTLQLRDSTTNEAVKFYRILEN